MGARKISLAISAAMLLLAGCATNTALYSWGNYEEQVYANFNGEAPEKQILAMESMLSQSQANGTKIPPGFYAHLGMLYDKVGRQEEARQMLALEKQTFPESARFIDQLNNNFKKVSTQ